MSFLSSSAPRRASRPRVSALVVLRSGDRFRAKLGRMTGRDQPPSGTDLSCRPDLRLERSFSDRGCGLVAGVDEVGRGAWAGPVSVGVVVVDLASAGPPPEGLADSKLLAPASRRALVPAIRAWAAACAVGHASAVEVDAFGIVAALRTAAWRALGELAVGGCRPQAILLDGSHDWLSGPEPARGGGAAPPTARLSGPEPAAAGEIPGLEVRTVVRGDGRCATVAAASVVAKVTRDDLLVAAAQDHPGYGFERHKGYGTAAHRAALASLGTCSLHRLTWRGVG